MTQNTRPRRHWWRIWLSAAAIIPLVAGGAAVASHAIEDEDAASTVSSVAPAHLADAVPTEPTAEAPAAIVDAPEPEPAPVAAQAEPVLTADPTDPTEISPPTVTASYPSAPGDNYGGWYTDGVTVTLNARATPPAFVDTIEWRLEGAASGSGRSTDASVQVPITADGTTTITFWASDTEGIASEEQSLTFKVDSIAPAPTISAPEARTYTAGETVMVSFWCGDAQTWLCGIEFSNGLRVNNGDVVEMTEDMTGATLSVMDFARHTTEVRIDFTVEPAPDVTAPVLTLTQSATPSATGWITAESSTLTVEAADASPVTVIEYRKFDLGEWTPWYVLDHGDRGSLMFYRYAGEWQGEFRATDSAGNTSEPVAYSAKFDSEISGATVSGFPGTFELGEYYELYYSCTDAVSKVAECSSSNGPSGTPLPTDTAGDFSFTLTNRDNAGNERTTTWTYTVGADTTAPLVGIELDATPNAAGWTSAGRVNVTFTATDGGGVDRLWVEGSGADPLTGQFIDGDSFLFTTDVEGITTFTAYAIDASGNQSTPVILELKLDRSAPWIEITSPANEPSLVAAVQEFALGSTVELDFTCGDAVSFAETCDGPATLPTSALGDHTVTIEAVDAAGNRTTETLEYTVVAAAPTEQPGDAQDPGKPATSGALATTGSSYPIWPAIAFVGIVIAIGAWMLASARRTDRNPTTTKESA